MRDRIAKSVDGFGGQLLRQLGRPLPQRSCVQGENLRRSSAQVQFLSRSIYEIRTKYAYLIARV